MVSLPPDLIIQLNLRWMVSLPPDLIIQLNLRWKRRGRAILGDGSECIFNVYEAVVVWDGVLLTIPVDEADSEPLVEMSLMEGYQLMVQVFVEGRRAELSKVTTVYTHPHRLPIVSWLWMQRLSAAGKLMDIQVTTSNTVIMVFSSLPRTN